MTFAFGFHTSTGGNKNGLGAFIQRLNAAGIPVMIKATADAGPAYEAQESGKQHGIDNLLIYRVTNNSIYEYDTPRYDLPPSQAAYLHWQATRAVWPPELDKSIVWMEPINEPRAKLEPDETKPTWGNMHPVAWLGLFMVEYASIANSQGFRVCGPSFSSGDPEPDLWQLEGMADWLRYCAENPDKAAIGVHEYNYGSVPFADNFPWHYGRFQAVIAAADILNIPRTFHIFCTEFGWQYENVPSWETAVPTLTEYAKMGAQFPQLKGVALWTLQMGWGGISDQLAQWISDNGNPMANWVINNQYPTMPQPQPTAVEFGATLPNEEPTMKHKAIVVKLPQDLTAPEWNEAAAVAFGFRHTMTASHDDMMTILNGGNAESFVKFSHSERDRAAVQMVEAAGYAWQPLYDIQVPTLEIIDIVNELPKHATLKYATRPITGITTLTIHHTVSPPDRSIESIAAYHVDSNGWPGIGYHFVIKDTGIIYQTNYLTTKSYHAGSSAPGDENLISVGIALQGDFTNAPPPQAQLDAARDLVAYLENELPTVTAVLGHRQMPGAATACPGATWQSWLPYITGDDIVIPPPPPPPAKKYSTSFMRGEAGIWRVIRRADGSGEDVWELPLSGNGDVRVKNRSEGEWYEYHSDGVYRMRDTSPAPDSQGNDRLYLLTHNGLSGGKIAPIEAELGVTYSYTNFVQFKKKQGCANLTENSGTAVSTFTLLEVKENYTFPTTGFKVDKLYVTEQTGEIQLYAEHAGRVIGWVGGGASQNNNVWGGELNEVYYNRSIPQAEPPRYC
jgi:hypothetical protein